MTRNEKISMLKELSEGRESEALKILREQQERAKIDFALKDCKAPILHYLAHRYGEPDEKVELVTEFVQGVKICKSNDEILLFVRKYEDKHREQMEDYVKNIDEYYKNKWQIKNNKV